MKVIEHVRDFIEADITALGAASDVIPLIKAGTIADRFLLFIDHDALAGSGGESLVITPKLVFGDDLTATAQKFACNVIDSNGAASAAAITITGTGAVGTKWYYIVAGNVGLKEIMLGMFAPGLLLEFANTNYTSGAMRFGYLIAG